MLHFNLGNLELVHLISLSFHFDYEKFVQISTGNCSLHFLSESCERDFNQICQSVSKLANIAGARMRHLLSTACSCFSSSSRPLGPFAYVVICASQFACMFAHSYFFFFCLSAASASACALLHLLFLAFAFELWSNFNPSKWRAACSANFHSILFRASGRVASTRCAVCEKNDKMTAHEADAGSGSGSSSSISNIKNGSSFFNIFGRQLVNRG